MTELLRLGNVYRLLAAEGDALKEHNEERFLLIPPSADLGGKSRALDVTDQVVDGRVLLTMQGASTLTLDISDPEWVVESSGVLDLDQDGRMGRIDFELNGVWFRLAQASRQDPSTLRLVFEDLTVAVLREHRKPLKASRGSMTRAKFIAKMVNELPAPLRLFFSPEQSDKQPVQAPKLPSAKPDPKDKTAGFSKGAKFKAYHNPATASEMREAATVLTVCDELNVTDLVREAIICAALGESGFAPERTSSAGAKGVFQMMPSWWSKINWPETEKQARWFIQHGFYKYGSAQHLATTNPHMSPGEIASRVEGSATDGQNAGYYNGFLTEARKIIKLWRSGSSSASSDTVFSLKEYQFTRGLPGRKESSWDAMQRLAAEVNWRLYVAGGVVVYATDDWLIDNPSRLTLTSPKTDDLVALPTYDWDHGKLAGDVILPVRATRWSQLPGSVVDLSGPAWGPISGYWLVEEIDQNLFDENDCQVTLTKPVPPRPEPAAEVVTTSRKTKPGTGSGTGSVAYVGDSLGVGTLPYFKHILSGTRLASDVVTGRSSASGVDALRTIFNARIYDNIVFDVGTNDTQVRQLRDSIRAVRKLAPQAQIYLLTMTGPNWVPPLVNFHVADKNRMLNGLSDAHIHVVDWNSFARRNNVTFDATHTHPDGAGYRGRAHLLARAMGFEA